VGLDSRRSQDSGRYPGERVAQSLAYIGTQATHEKWMADLTAMVAVTIAPEGQQREADWGVVVDGRPQTELGRDRRPVLCVEHEPLPRYSLAHWAVGAADVDAIPGPVRCDFELGPTLILYIRLSVKETRGSSGKADKPC
jgi:hypothetical protein